MTNPALPENLSYTAEHEWIALAPGAEQTGDPVRVGITALAVENLGDLVYLELPDVGSTVTVGESCGEVESTKTVSELYPPVTGKVSIINTAAVENPEVVTSDPYGEGWLFAVIPDEVGELWTAAKYASEYGVQ
ncbi:glycine cleavage system protein GcvH [Gordonia terrae]|uniref:Glycine cleavage system H protein n=2 Tax=Gordonia terrae TaxID=2055 RepID=A0AAD0K7Q0_9ACTN|nr:glycine cleavage system protein GcvH [Gordonia terrae]VTR08854.1 glycine cleavage system H protein [Clostridioides difficile]ANY21596.1 glycine cleavage system protein H [Gordonia terrae]AWO82324.1 glycine cleavage system protein GcvH [Gordonia terrae]VTS17393.1 Glycine cleavage system H protein [Gordonia terrae]GAB44608.1 glycine cleavage system H protein [Gordonia terrae NBRC 100016]